MKALSCSYVIVSTEHISASVIFIFAEPLDLPMHCHWNDTLEIMYTSAGGLFLLTMKVYDSHQPHFGYNAVGKFLIGNDLYSEIMADLNGDPGRINPISEKDSQAILDKFETGVIGIW